MNILPTLAVRAIPDMASSHSAEPEPTQPPVFTYDGLRMNPMFFSRDVLVRIKDMELSSSDVLLSSYVKAGRYDSIHVKILCHTTKIDFYWRIQRTIGDAECVGGGFHSSKRHWHWYALLYYPFPTLALAMRYG